MDVKMNGWLDWWAGELMEEQMDGWIGGQVAGRWMDGWKNGSTN